MPAKPLNKEGPKPAGFGRVFKRAAGPKGPAALGRLGKAAAAAAVGIELGNEKDRKSIMIPLSWQELTVYRFSTSPEPTKAPSYRPQSTGTSVMAPWDCTDPELSSPIDYLEVRS